MLLIAGLFFAGLVFNWLNEKAETIYASWMVHMFANFAINTIGYILFGIL
jgi:CAAX amino terminal protease family.